MQTNFRYWSRSCVLCVCVLLASLARIASATEAQQIFRGVGLQAPLEIPVQLEADSVVWVSASQRSADYLIRVYDVESGSLVKQVNLPGHKSVDEIVLFDGTECQVCRVSVEGSAQIEKSSPYHVVVHTLTERANQPEQRAEIATLDAISMVGELNYLANEAQDKDIEALLLRAQADLVARLSVIPQNQHSLHAFYLKLQLAGMLRDRESMARLSGEVIAAHGQQNTLFKVQAIYDQARMLTSVNEQHARFREGMAIAQLINEPILYAKGANYLAISLTREAQFEAALALFRQVYDIYAEHQNFTALLYALNNLSWVNQRAGNLPQSISYAAQLKLVAEENGSQPSVLRALYNMAIAYGEQGDRYVADQFLDQAMEKFKLLTEIEKRNESRFYGELLRERAQSRIMIGDYQSASDFTRQARERYKEFDAVRDLARVDILDGEIALAESRFDDARGLLLGTLKYYQNTGESRTESLTHLRLADLEMSLKNWAVASVHNASALKLLAQTEDYLSLSKAFSQAVALLSQMRAVDDAEKLAARVSPFVRLHGRDDVFVQFAYRRALNALNSGDRVLASQLLAEARDIVEQTLPKVRRRDLRRSYLALQKSLFELNVALLVDNQQPVEALRLVESFKARTLRETIAQVREDDLIPPNLRQSRQILHDKILQSATTWYGNTDSQQLSLLTNTRSLSSELEKIETEIQTYLVHQVESSNAQGFIELPSVIDQRELIAYYFLGEQRSWLWIIGEQGISLHNLPPADELDKQINAAKRQISQHPALRQEMTAYQQRMALVELGSVLLTPVLAKLDPAVENLTVIPDGAIHGLAFGPLRTRPEDKPLLTRVALSYAPSFQALKALEERAAKRPTASEARLLVVADPIDLTPGANFERLPQSAREAQQIQSLMPNNTEVLMAASATKRSAIKAIANEYSILHFATHGLLNNRSPALSGLVFSKDSNEPNYWLTPEISSTPIHAGLVVLSACESSIGREVAGEGLMSLSRAFIEAGANNVIGTLWKVQDAATAELTSRFYSHLLDDRLAVSIALQRAQLAVYSNTENDWRDPYFWAGFQLQGGWQTLAYGR